MNTTSIIILLEILLEFSPHATQLQLSMNQMSLTNSLFNFSPLNIFEKPIHYVTFRMFSKLFY